MEEVAWLLRPRHEGWVIDGTVGMGGHAAAILERGGADVRLLGLAVDPVALERASEGLARFGDRVRLRRANFRDLAEAAAGEDVREARSILLALGVSSYQLAEAGRGFSFLADEPLNMRLDPSARTTAVALVNELPEAELARIIFEYGEERHARRIARSIVRRRPLTTTGDLVAAVRDAVPRAAWSRRLHVATRTFHAIRMAVNDEPGALRQALSSAPALLAAGSRLGCIAFHSGEDRIVKQAFRTLARQGFDELEPSPLVPGDDEVRANPRARSAKLRVQSVHLGYRLDAVRAEHAELTMLLRQLQVELATQRSPARIESRARELGLVMPAREQVRLAREFVPGDSGVAAAQQGRVEASLR